MRTEPSRLPHTHDKYKITQTRRDERPRPIKFSSCPWAWVNRVLQRHDDTRRLNCSISTHAPPPHTTTHHQNLKNHMNLSRNLKKQPKSSLNKYVSNVLRCCLGHRRCCRDVAPDIVCIWNFNVFFLILC